MDARKIVDKLEHDLSHYIISELCNADPTKRASSELYKYKGLSITVDPRSKKHEKTFSVRIGVLEAEFKVSSGEKVSGSLAPQEEKLVRFWMSQSDNGNLLRMIFEQNNARKEVPILPFDLEDVFDQI